MMLWAHHVEPQHVPVLALFLAIGAWIGWRAVSLLCKRPDGTNPADR